MLRLSKCRLEKNFQTQSSAERSRFIKNKEQREYRHCERSGLTTSDRPGRVNSFRGLVANFYSLMTKKIPAGRLALGGWLEC